MPKLNAALPKVLIRAVHVVAKSAREAHAGLGRLSRLPRARASYYYPLRAGLLAAMGQARSPRHAPGPNRADRWRWMVLHADTQLRLASALAEDRSLPWQRPQLVGTCSPARVRHGFSTRLPRFPILARALKPGGRSPGRSKVKRSGRARHSPASTKALLSASATAKMRPTACSPHLSSSRSGRLVEQV